MPTNSALHMKSAVLSALYLLIGLFSLRAESPPLKYSGEANVEGLGTIAFPAGEWLLEFRRVQPVGAAAYLRDYFTFKKVDGDFERLTFYRYRPECPTPLDHMLDGLTEERGDGVPVEEWLQKTKTCEDTVSMRPVHDGSSKEKYIRFTFFVVQKLPLRSWLCHSYLFTHQVFSFVITHSSQFVTNPITVADVGDKSRFLTSPPKAPNK